MSVRGRALEREHRLLERRVLADHLRQAEAPLVVLPQQDQLGDQPALLDRPVEQELQVVGVDRLHQEVGGTFLHRAHGLLDRAEGRHHDDGRLGVGVPRGREHVEAAAGRQPQVGQDHEIAEGLQAPARLVRVAGLVDLVAARLERLPQHRAERLLVLDDQDLGHGDAGRSAQSRLALLLGRAGAGARGRLAGLSRPGQLRLRLLQLVRARGSSVGSLLPNGPKM